jgi:hypothetical protein
LGFAPRLYNEKFQESSQFLSEVETVQLKISFEAVVKNWVEFWKWQWKVNEKKW